ncbi:MAG: NAD(P)H-binding protein [Bdellovibrionota bacterium]
MKTIAIAGASGYTGKRLVPLLKDAKLKLFLRPETASKSPWKENPATVAVSCMDPAALEPHLKGVDEIICVVGTTRSQFREGISYETVDIGIPRALAQAGKKAGVKKIHLLTSAGAGGMGAYMKAKKKAEDAVTGSGLTYTIVRPSGITGEGRRFFQAADVLFKPLVHVPGISDSAWKYVSIPAERLAGIFATLTRTDQYDNQVLQGEILQKMELR